MTLAKTLPVSGPYENNTLSYPFYFNVGGADEVIVWVGNTRVYEGFTIDLGESGGEVTFNSIPEDKVTITANVDFSQEVDLVNNSAFLPEVIEDGLDKLTRMAQINKAELQRAVKVPYGSEDTPEEYAEKLITQTQTTAINAVNSAKTSAISAVGTKQGEAVSAVNSAKGTAVDAVNEAKEEALSQIGGSVGRVYRPKGAVSTYANLPMSKNEVGDVYTVLDTGAEYFWKEDNSWEYLGDKIDLSAYAKKSDVPSVEGLASTKYVDGEIDKIEAVLGQLDTALAVTESEVI